MGTILVTGGSRGIGRAVVEALAAPPPLGAGSGAAVAFTWRSRQDAARQVEVATGGRARAFQLDLRDRAGKRELGVVRR